MGRLTSWISRNFGATPADAGPETLEVVFEGSASECQMVGLRLQQAGFFVDPDPTPRYVGFGVGTTQRGTATRDDLKAINTVSVLATDADAARAVLEQVDPI